MRGTSARPGAEPGSIGEALDAIGTVVALHDRRLPGRTGRRGQSSVDHLVVAASGIWVIDAKTHYGPVDLRRTGGALTPRVERLFINNRDRTRLVTTLRGHVATVQRIVVDAGFSTEVRGALCFVGTRLPWVSEAVAGIALVDELGLFSVLQAQGPVAADERRELAALLDRHSAR